MIARTMVIVRAPGSEDTPMVKIANRLLDTMGFSVGTHIEVIYQQGQIIIKLINENEFNNVQKSGPLATPAAPVSKTTAVESQGAGCAKREFAYSQGNPTPLRFSSVYRNILAR